MRTMMKVIIPVEKGNAAIKDGSLPKIIGEAIERLQPEASYFLTDGGSRSCLMVFDLKDPADIPSIAEPFFMGLNATVSFSPAMNAEDLQKGLGQVK